jgi:NTE family protein
MSGWVALFRGRRHAPRILDIMMRTTMLGSEQQQQSVTGSIDLLINPAIEEFGMFDWHRLDEIVEAGYQSARTAIALWNQR